MANEIPTLTDNYNQMHEFLIVRGATRAAIIGALPTADGKHLVRFEAWLYKDYSFILARLDGGVTIYGRVGNESTSLEQDMRYLESCFRSVGVKPYVKGEEDDTPS